jgi:CubicO group peptidase (beta-lactamase class C family)
MKKRLLQLSTIFALTFTCAPVLAAPCEAYYRFDGNLKDSSANGVHGSMFAAEGLPATPVFDEGVQGQSLLLDGKSAMRSYLDLHYDFCPQVTIAGWVKIGSKRSSTQYLVATEQGGPGIRTSGRTAVLMGSGNGLSISNAVRDPRAWFFFAAVFDYDARTYRFQWRDRIVEGKLADSARAAADSLWVGALNDRLSYAIDATYIDELRIVGRALSHEEVTRLRGGRQGALTRLETGQSKHTAGSKEPIGSVASKRTDITAANLPDRPPLLPGSGLLEPTSDDTVQIELKEGVGIGAGGGVTPDANLRLPGDDPASELQDQLDTIAKNPPVNLAGRVQLKEDVGAAGGLTPDANLALPEDTPGSRLQEDLDAIPDKPTFEKVDVIECDSQVVPVVAIQSNVTFPEQFTKALNQVANCGFDPQVVAINSKDQWIISAGGQIARSTNLPAELARTLDEYERSHGQIDAAHISAKGSWLVAANDEYAESGLNLQARFRAGSITRNGGRVVSFSINPTDADRWLMVDDSGNVYGEPRPWQVNAAAAQFPISQIRIRQAQHMPDGSWILLGTDHWYLSDGLRDQQLRVVNQLRTNNKNISHFLGYRAAGEYMIVTNGTPPMRSSDRIWQVENNMNGGNIWARMNAFGLTGVAIAVVRNNDLAWARGYGLRNSRELEDFIQPDTTFDAASVSKPVAALALMQLVDDPGVELDITATGGLEAIETLFDEEDLEDLRDQIKPESGNIAQIMQHCAGACYGLSPDCSTNFVQAGAQAYAENTRLPTTAQIIMGTSPADSSHRIKRDGTPGGTSRYTSANFAFVQALIEVHGGGFVSHTGRLLRDLGMTSSTFAAPYPLRKGEKFARGHSGSGAPQPLSEYAEMAAASLISTAPDMAQFIIALNQGGGSVLSADTFDQFVGRDTSVNGNSIASTFCATPGTMALGVRRTATHGAWGNIEAIWHGGLHNGYRTRMEALPGEASGVFVVMTGSATNADSFFSEFRTSFRNAYSIP